MGNFNCSDQEMEGLSFKNGSLRQEKERRSLTREDEPFARPSYTGEEFMRHSLNRPSLRDSLTDGNIV